MSTCTIFKLPMYCCRYSSPGSTLNVGVSTTYRWFNYLSSLIVFLIKVRIFAVFLQLICWSIGQVWSWVGKWPCSTGNASVFTSLSPFQVCCAEFICMRVVPDFKEMLQFLAFTKLFLAVKVIHQRSRMYWIPIAQHTCIQMRQWSSESLSEEATYGKTLTEHWSAHLMKRSMYALPS